jgi:hypothetical protein
MVVSSVPGAKVGADRDDAVGVEAVPDGAVTDGGGAEFGDDPPAAAPNKFGADGVWPSAVFAGAVGEADACADDWDAAPGAAVTGGAALDGFGCAAGGATSIGAGGCKDAGTAATRSGRFRSSVDR